MTTASPSPTSFPWSQSMTPFLLCRSQHPTFRKVLNTRDHSLNYRLLGVEGGSDLIVTKYPLASLKNLKKKEGGQVYTTN